MVQGSRRRAHSIALLVVVLATGASLSACTGADDPAIRDRLADSAACAGLEDDMEALTSLRRASSASDKADVLADLASSLESRISEAAAVSDVRNALLVASDAVALAEDQVREAGGLANEEISGLDNALVTLQRECQRAERGW